MTQNLRVAAAAYPVGAIATWADCEVKLARWCAEGAAGGAELLVFPEYAAMELLPLLPPAARGDLRAQPSALAELWPTLRGLYAALAEEYGVFLLPGTLPVPTPAGVVNRAHLFAPDGTLGWQDKLQRTRFEAEVWGLAPGQGQRVFRTPLGTLGIAVCYDAEFPARVRPLLRAGAELLCVPACTDTLAGHHRVRVASRARALEGQCFALHAPTVGDLPDNPALDVNVGASGIFGPVERGFPPDGILASGLLNAPGWVHATLDLDAAAEARRDGEVLLHREGIAAEARGQSEAPVEVVELG